MVILSLETATRAGSVAIADGTRHHARGGDTTRTHSERLPEELFHFLAEQGKQLDDVDYLAVVTGPGSFTGLRIGIAAVQGIAVVAMKAVIPIPTLDAMASAWAHANPTRTVRLVTCLDGARGDVFFAVFDVSTKSDPVVVTPPAVSTPPEATERLVPLADGAQVVMVGDGAVRYRSVFGSQLPSAAVDDRHVTLALGASLLAVKRRSQAAAPHALRPLYVRRPDAVLARERLLASQAGALTIGRVTKPEDLATVAELQRRSFANAWGAEALRWELDHSDVARLYVARAANGAIVAYCACWFVHDELHINSVAVDLSHRRRGVARRLLEAVLRDAVAEGAQQATLEVRQSNDAARLLYEGLGFGVEGVRRNYYQNPREDALILWHRDLPSVFGAAG